MEFRKHLSKKEKLQRNALISSAIGITVVLIAKNNDGPIILFWLGIVIGAIFGLHYLKK